jgi:hypothetical protein
MIAAAQPVVARALSVPRLLRGPWSATVALVLTTTAPLHAQEPASAEGNALVSDADPTPPPPEGTARALSLNEEGAALYAAREYRRALEKFLQAQAVGDDPNLLFNIASCYEKLGDSEAAVEKYRAFVAAPDADPEGRRRAMRAIELLTEPAPSEPAPQAEVTAPSVAPQPEPMSDVGVAPSPLVPWLTLGAGAALFTAGGLIYFWGMRDHAAVTDAAGYGDPSAIAVMTAVEARSLVDSGETKKWLGGSSMALGGALMGSYLVLALIESSKASAAAPRGLSVSVLPTGGSLTWAGAF